MWSLALLALCACTDIITAYYGGMGLGAGAVTPYYDPYMSMGAMGGMGGMGGPAAFGGPRFDFLDDRSSGEPEVLNCYASYLTDDGRNVANEIAVTIEKRRDGDDEGIGGFGMGMGMGMGVGYGMGVGFESPGSTGRGRGLSARVELINNIENGKGFIVFTKTARSDDGCFRESFGDIWTKRDVDDDDDHHHTMAGYGMGGYGMMGYGLDIGMMGYGMGFGMGHHQGSMFAESREGEGVVAEINVTPGALTSAVIEDIGFQELSQLAGRGVLVCSNVDYDWDWKPTCLEPYYSCCSLKYDIKGVSLTGEL